MGLVREADGRCCVRVTFRRRASGEPREAKAEEADLDWRSLGGKGII